MKFTRVLPLILVLVLGVASKAEEGLPGRTAGAGAAANDKADKAATEAGARAAGREKADGPVTNHVGTLEKSGDAKYAAVLKAHGKSLNLLASGEVAEKLAGLAGKGAKVRVAGVESGADAIQVSKVTEAGEKAADGDKPKKKKKSDDK